MRAYAKYVGPSIEPSLIFGVEGTKKTLRCTIKSERVGGYHSLRGKKTYREYSAGNGEPEYSTLEKYPKFEVSIDSLEKRIVEILPDCDPEDESDLKEMLLCMRHPTIYRVLSFFTVYPEENFWLTHQLIGGLTKNLTRDPVEVAKMLL